MYNDPIIKWSREVLPKNDEIGNLPTLSIPDFIDAISDSSVRWEEDESRKMFNPSIFTTNKSVFVDIDHVDDYFDEIWDKREDLFADCPFIVMIKQSRSKSFHCICIGDWEDEVTYSNLAMFYLACIAKSILKHTGIDLREVKGSLDTHTKSLKQRLFVYNPQLHPYALNPYPNKVSYENLLDKAFEEYPQLCPKKKIERKYNSDYSLSIDFKPMKRSDKILLNKSYEVAGFVGNDARWRIANALYYIFKEDEEKAKQVIEDNFSNPSEFRFNSVDKGYNREVLNWVLDNLQIPDPVPEGYNDSSTLPDIDDVCQHYNVTNIMMNQEEYLYDYRDKIMSNSREINYIAAGTGTGKTEFVKQLQLEHQRSLSNSNDSSLFEEQGAGSMRCDLCYPMTSTLEGKDGVNKIYTKDLSKENNYWQSSDSMTMIIDTLYKMVEGLGEDYEKRDYLFIDESHMLVSEIGYRPKMIRLLMDMGKYYKKVFFMSGTTWKEYDFLAQNSDISASDMMIFNCTKPQQVRTLMKVYQYDEVYDEERKEKLDSDGNPVLKKSGKDKGQPKEEVYRKKKTYQMHLRQLIYDNTRRGVKTIVFTNGSQRQVIKMLQERGMQRQKIVRGVYSRPTKQGSTVKNINEKNTMGDVDVMTSTAYMSVGVELKEDLNYCFIFLDDNITAQEIQQVKERDRIGKNCVVVYRCTKDRKEDDEDYLKEEVVEGIVNDLNNNEWFRKFYESGNEKKVFIERDDHGVYLFRKDIWSAWKFGVERRREWRDIDYIKEFFEKKGVKVEMFKIKEDELTEKSYSRNCDNEEDGLWVVDHVDELIEMYEKMGEFESLVDYFVEYDRGEKRTPIFYEGKYYFNNTRYVLTVLECLSFIGEKRRRDIVNYAKENKRVINVNRLKEYTEILKLVQYQKEMRVVVKHIIESLKKSDIEALQDRANKRAFCKKERDYVMKSNKVEVEKLSDLAVSKVKEIVKDMVGGVVRFFVSHPEKISEVENLLNNDTEIWYEMFTEDVMCAVFDELNEDHRVNDHRKKKITVDGVEYESIADVCKVMEWSENALKVMMNRNKYKPQFKYKGHVIDR